MKSGITGKTKKALSLFFTVMFVLSLAACGQQENTGDEQGQDVAQNKQDEFTLALSATETAAAPEKSSVFTDVPADAWYAQAVAWCRENGVMNGRTETLFDPDYTLSRAVVATTLYRWEGTPTVDGMSSFSDNATGTYYHDAVIWAASRGITTGYTDGTFRPNAPVTRQQLAAFLWRYAGEPATATMAFPDQANVSGSFVNAVNWAVTNHILLPGSDGNYTPAQNSTRAEVAHALYTCLSNPDVVSSNSNTDTNINSHILIAYFSRADENYGVGVIEKGNTEIMAEMIAEQTGGDLFHIETVKSYPATYKECTEVAQQEQEEHARPELTTSVTNWGNYDTVFLGYPIWWGNLPMAMYTFMEQYDWNGKTIYPFNTHGGSGSAGTWDYIRETCTGAVVNDGLAIAGTTAQNDRETTRSSIISWLDNYDIGAEAQTPESTENSHISAVYMTTDISPKGLAAVYGALGWTPTGKVAVKLSTGEPPASNYLRPELISHLVQSVNGTIVECNTAYGGSRAQTAMHYQVAKDHGFTDIAEFQILDENGSMTLPVSGGSVLTENYVGAAFGNYDSYLILSHFKGHSMAGFGGAIKNISIGLGSSQGKAWIHSGGTSLTNPWGGQQDAFLESMAEAGKSVSDYLGNGERIVYLTTPHG